MQTALWVPKLQLLLPWNNAARFSATKIATRGRRDAQTVTDETGDPLMSSAAARCRNMMFIPLCYSETDAYKHTFLAWHLTSTVTKGWLHLTAYLCWQLAWIRIWKLWLACSKHLSLLNKALKYKKWFTELSIFSCSHLFLAWLRMAKLWRPHKISFDKIRKTLVWNGNVLCNSTLLSIHLHPTQLNASIFALCAQYEYLTLCDP